MRNFKEGIIVSDDYQMRYKLTDGVVGRTVRLYYSNGYCSDFVGKLAIKVVIGDNGEFNFYTKGGYKDICTAEHLMSALKILNSEGCALFSESKIYELKDII